MGAQEGQTHDFLFPLCSDKIHLNVYLFVDTAGKKPLGIKNRNIMTLV